MEGRFHSTDFFGASRFSKFVAVKLLCHFRTETNKGQFDSTMFSEAFLLNLFFKILAIYHALVRYEDQEGRFDSTTSSGASRFSQLGVVIPLCHVRPETSKGGSIMPNILKLCMLPV